MAIEPENPGARHETRDANIRGLIIFGVGLFVSLVVILFLMSKLFHYFATAQSLGPPASPFADQRVLPPPPRLQLDPRQDLKGVLAEQDRILHNYGWVDENAGIVRIPIDRAVDLVLERGLPVRGGNPGKPTNP